jgi:hypothetical protein
MPDSVLVQRCCESHSDYLVLSRHLIVAFPGITGAEVVSVLGRARHAVESFGLPEAEHLWTVETIARYELLQLTGEMKSNARLKPEHRERPRAADPDPVGS